VLELTLDRAVVAPGKEVTGTVAITSSGPCRALSVALRFVERSARLGVGAEVLAELDRGDLVAGQRYRFALTLPPEALPETGTGNLQLFWEVRTWADRRLAGDPDARAPIQVIRLRAR